MRSLVDVLNYLTRDRQLLLLYLLYAKRCEPIKGNLWLQKEMFVIEKTLDTRDKYYFIDHFKGPFSDDLMGEIDYLISLNLAEKDEKGVYRITQKGKMLIDYLMKKNVMYKLFNKKTLDVVEDVKDLLNDLNRDELLGYIYFNYPETTERSEEFERIKKEKMKIVTRLYKKGKISLERAAEILDMPVKELIRMMKGFRVLH